MPIIKSAKKRVRVANKAAVRNSKTKRTLKNALKLFARKSNAASQGSAQSALDIAVKKGVLHKNKAARLKKQLSLKVKRTDSPAAAPKKTTKKAAAKKATPKRASTKKTAAKKKTSV